MSGLKFRVHIRKFEELYGTYRFRTKLSDLYSLAVAIWITHLPTYEQDLSVPELFLTKEHTHRAIRPILDDPLLPPGFDDLRK